MRRKAAIWTALVAAAGILGAVSLFAGHRAQVTRSHEQAEHEARQRAWGGDAPPSLRDEDIRRMIVQLEEAGMIDAKLAVEIERADTDAERDRLWRKLRELQKLLWIAPEAGAQTPSRR
jgi:hypothetical protein